jgi:hypothetical protein
MSEDLNSFTHYFFPQAKDGSTLLFHIQRTKTIEAICLFSRKTFFDVSWNHLVNLCFLVIFEHFNRIKFTNVIA